MEIGFFGPIFIQKNISRFMGQRYPQYTIWEKNIIVILHIYGDRAIYLFFYNHQDTESESWVNRIFVSGPIITQKNIKGAIGQQYSYSTRWGGNILVFI